MWPNARISVMGGQQAARVLSTVRGEMSDAERDAFEAPIRDVRARGQPYYSTARLWDDGMIDPLDTRRVLALGLEPPSRRAGAADDVRGVPDVSAVALTRAGRSRPSRSTGRRCETRSARR